MRSNQWCTDHTVGYCDARDAIGWHQNSQNLSHIEQSAVFMISTFLVHFWLSSKRWLPDQYLSLGLVVGWQAGGREVGRKRKWACEITQKRCHCPRSVSTCVIRSLQNWRRRSSYRRLYDDNSHIVMLLTNANRLTDGLFRTSRCTTWKRYWHTY